MKKLVLLAVLVLLTACTLGTDNEKKEDTAKENNAEVKEFVSKHPKTTSGVGQICGGDSGENCHQGLSCIFDYDTADGHGLCAEKIVDNKECENVYEPTCGLNDDRQKYTYFNKCHLERHGAEMLNEGKCKLDKNVAGNCEAHARGFSNCFDTTEAYEFNGEKCVKKMVSSCGDAEVPFESLETCESSCL